MLTHFFVNVPYDLLVKKYLPLFARQHLNPEIYFSPQILDKWPEDEFKAVAREVEQFDLKTTFHAPFYDLSLGSIEPKVRRVTQERLEQILSLADFFHPLSIVIHLSYDARIYEEHLEEWLENTVQTIGKIIPVAEKQKIYLNLENVFESEPNIFLLVLKRFTSDYIGICFDIGHIYAFTHTTLEKLEQKKILAKIKGEDFNPQKHPLNACIKAVTYHNFKVNHIDDRFQAQVIFDI